ncbi:MAG: NAD-dependent protein deacylase, partial [Gordonia sp. (in: high G+C Gram-positive bacteria)]|uniref:NAD-dependent protein deacylase n=1 Tax=Gordonia sp. (in: high G+C Gram-positive bacteria) TaxID=84139 RepID=UPI003BB604D1
MTDLERLAAARRLVDEARNVVVFTGAGMSAESGVPTFRDSLTGLWATFDPASLATPEAWRADRALVWSWYASRVQSAHAVAPHAGHMAVAELARRKAGTGGRVDVITQNVDDLHERAGVAPVIHLHGSLFAPRCDTCGASVPVECATNSELPQCAVCPGKVRPGVVWFNEPLPADAWLAAESAFADAALVVVVGTRGVVYPAASLPAAAAHRGVSVIEINPEPSELLG